MANQNPSQSEDHFYEVQKQLQEVLTEEDFIIFCFDQYPEIYEHFSHRMTFREKIKSLLDHCVKEEETWNRL